MGTVVRTGSKVEGGLKVGDLVGVGAQSDSCLGRKGDCQYCAMGLEQYCPKMTGTYNSTYMNGGKSYGGYALYNRVPSHFAIKIPDTIPPAEAAPMLCGGLTMFSPLKFNGCGPGKNVAIAGVGGLGHFGILFAKAMGARVTAISRSDNKYEDAKKLGADDFIATNDVPDWATKYADSMDIVLNSASSSQAGMANYIKILKPGGSLVQIGLPQDGKLDAPVGPLTRRKRVEGSLIGSPDEIREMFALVAGKGIKPWIQVRPMEDANNAIVDFNAGKPRYRYVLANKL